MAADAKPSSMPNGIMLHNKPYEVCITLPQSPGTKLYMHLTVLASSIMLFLASAAVDASASGAAMGSFVFAMPDRYNPAQPLSTSLYTLPSSMDFATRMAKLLARRTQRPCYVGSSISLGALVGGEAVDEEMAVFRAIADAATSHIQQVSDSGL